MLIGCGRNQSNSSHKPNIIFILADDMGYGDFVAQIDDVVGQIMEKVKQEGLKRNTVLIFTSDNGPVWFHEDVMRYQNRSTVALRGMKIDSWEGGHRIPFIARWPGKIKPGTKSSALLDFTDMMTTLAAVSGDTLQKNSSHDSYNQLPVWTGEQSRVRSVLPVAGTIRRGDWKLIIGNGLGGLHRHYGSVTDTATTKGVLYNLQNDLSEQHNLCEINPEEVHRLQRLWDSLKQVEVERAPEP